MKRMVVIDVDYPGWSRKPSVLINPAADEPNLPELLPGISSQMRPSHVIVQASTLTVT